MHVTYQILEYYHAFDFFNQAFSMKCFVFLNSLRQIVKTKESFDA